MLDALLLLTEIVVVVGLGASVWFYVTGCIGARRVLVPRPRQAVRSDPPGGWPGVTILKPLKGLDADLFENLSTFCRQDYGPFQLVFGVADAADPAVQVVQRLRDHYPNVCIDLVIDARVYGTNYKISNLENMYASARFDLLVIADSDIRVRSDYLCRIVEALQDPGVGVATCLYRATSTGDLPSFVESLFVNTDFVPMVLVAGVVETPTYAFGATMALRRSVLDEVGGFRALTNYLADDYYLGFKVAQRGYRLVLIDMVVETVLAVGSWRRLSEHQLRWARTYRSVRPAGYFASILTHGMFWSLVFLLLNGFSGQGWLVVLAMASLRVWTARYIANHHLHAALDWKQGLAVPFKDLFVTSVWFTAFLGNTVHWSGHEFRVQRDGELERLSPPLPVAQAVVTKGLYREPAADKADPENVATL